MFKLPPNAPKSSGHIWPAVSVLKRLRRAFCLAACLLAFFGARAHAAKPARTLVFGMSAAFSGPARSLGTEYQRGIMAAFAQFNGQSGADGWRLVLSLRDDAYDPAAALANTIAFVEEERVFALLGYVGTPTTARVLPLLKHYGSRDMTLLFPLTGADMLRDHFYDDSVFNLRGSYQDETRTLVEALLASGHKRIAVFQQADIYGRNGWDGVRRALAAHGLSMVAEATYRRGARFSQDFQSEVAILLRGNPDAIVTVGTAPACAGFVRDLRAAGFNDLAATLSFADADNMVRYLQAQARVTGKDYLTGMVFSQVVPSYEDRSLPAVRLYQQAMARLSTPRPPQLTPEEYTPQRLGFVSFEGFLVGLALAKVVTRLGGPPTRARLRAALVAAKPIDLGLREKVDLRPGGKQDLPRTYLTVFRNGHFTDVDTLKAVAR